MTSQLPRFEGECSVTYRDGHWFVDEAFAYVTELADRILVPEGTPTDGASIPRIFWCIMGHPFGKYAPAAVVHDWLYQSGVVSRKEADQIFLEAMKHLKVNWVRRKIMYRAVRMFAGFAWRRYRKRHSNGSVC